MHTRVSAKTGAIIMDVCSHAFTKTVPRKRDTRTHASTKTAPRKKGHAHSSGESQAYSRVQTDRHASRAVHTRGTRDVPPETLWRRGNRRAHRAHGGETALAGHTPAKHALGHSPRRTRQRLTQCAFERGSGRTLATSTR
nr:MAG: MC040.1L [Molluscum contagiosum virus]